MKKEILDANPFLQFEQWYTAAKAKGEVDLDAMALGTASAAGKPSVRIVLYKGFNEKGFFIYTNYGSRKASDLSENPYAALTFYWPKSYQQVRIEGKVERLTHAESDAYFQTRPRESQLGAWASIQSNVISSRETLELRVKEVEERFKDKVVPCPDFWGGYALKPTLFEFWQGREYRLHDRFQYRFENNEWVIERLAP